MSESDQFSLVFRPVPLEIALTEEADNFTGTNAGLVIDALGGNDTITGGLGNDVINGCAGNDCIDGGGGQNLPQWRNRQRPS